MVEGYSTGALDVLADNLQDFEMELCGVDIRVLEQRLSEPKKIMYVAPTMLFI